MAATARKVNWFAIWVSVAVVVVLVRRRRARREPQPVGGRSRARRRRRRTSTPRPARSSSATARTRSTTYIDFMCPVCNQFEQLYGPTIQGLVDDGTITLGIHPIAILDRQSQGTEYSTRAANAMYCVAVADAEAVRPVHAGDVREPARRRGRPASPTTQILEIASGVGVDGHRRLRQRRQVLEVRDGDDREDARAARRRRHRHADDRR